MKPVICLILSAFLILSVTACGEKEAIPSSSTKISSVEVSSETPEDMVSSTFAYSNDEFLETVAYMDYALTGKNEPYFVGRWFEKEIDGKKHMVTVTDGSTLYFLVKGADSVDVSFTVITGSDIPFFSYSIDGAAPIRQAVTKSNITLPTKGRHTVRIIADGVTEHVGKWYDEKGFALREVTASDGGEIFGIRPKNKTIFYYGDSITEGICSLSHGYSSPNNSATNAYPWFCSEKLGVVPYYIGYGGSGIIKEGSFRPLDIAIDSFSFNTPATETSDPDIIVINHGTNDSDISDETFKDSLTSALKKLRKTHPNVPIVYMIPFAQTKASIITEVMKNIKNGYVVKTEGWGISTHDGLHPDSTGAKKAGEKLANELQKIFGKDFFN